MSIRVLLFFKRHQGSTCNFVLLLFFVFIFLITKLSLCFFQLLSFQVVSPFASTFLGGLTFLLLSFYVVKSFCFFLFKWLSHFASTFFRWLKLFSCLPFPFQVVKLFSCFCLFRWLSLFLASALWWLCVFAFFFW